MALGYSCGKYLAEPTRSASDFKDLMIRRETHLPDHTPRWLNEKTKGVE
jgi:hypothetical protein